MDCNDLAQIFAGDHEADLEGAQDRAFMDHLSACMSCREILVGAEGQLDTLVDLVEPEPLPEPSPEPSPPPVDLSELPEPERQAEQAEGEWPTPTPALAD